MPPVSRVNTMEFISSPLVQSNTPGGFLRQVLAECARFGIDGRTITVFDGLAAIMGINEPLPASQSAYLSGPLVQWRNQPTGFTQETVVEVERLAYRQRALIAFGAAKPGHIVGTADLVYSCGNYIKGNVDPELFELFTWASLDVLVTITGQTKEQLLNDPQRKGWSDVDDDEVLKPGGRLWNRYNEVATTIRRTAIEAEKQEPLEPRKLLRPFAALFVENHRKVRENALAEGLTTLVERLDGAIASITGMYPDLGTVEEEAARQRSDMMKSLLSDFGESEEDAQNITRGLETALRVADSTDVDLSAFKRVLARVESELETEAKA